MISLAKLIECMPERSLRDLLYDGNCDVSHGIYLLETNTVLEPHSIYVGKPAAILPFLSRKYDFTVTFVSSGVSDEYGDVPYENVNLCITDISVTSLYNYMNRTLMRFITLHSDFSDACHRGASIDAIAQIIAGYLPSASLYILDSGLKLMARRSLIPSNRSAYSAFAARIDGILSTAGYLDVETARELDTARGRRGDPFFFFKRLSSTRTASHYLLLFFPEDQTIKSTTIQLIRQIYGELVDYFTENAPSLILSPEIGEFIQTLMDRKIKTKNEAKTRLISMGAPSFKYVTCMVAEFEPGESSFPADYLAGKIKDFFPQSVAAAYQNDLIFFLPASRSGEFPSYDRQAMETLLESCGAYLGLAFPVRSLLSLPTMY